MNRAYSTFQVKSIDEEERVIEGIASTPSVDRMGDIVEPMGAKFALPLPALLFHDTENPVATVEAAKATKAGITYRMRFPAAGLLESVDRAWILVKERLVRGVSIGFKPLKWEPIEDSKVGGLRFLSWEWFELSLVTVPANAEATISTIKSYDEAQTASGRKREAVSLTTSPGVPGKQLVIPKGTPMKTIQEDIQDATNKRAATVARAEEIQGKARDEGREMDDTEGQEFDTLLGEVKSIDKHLVRQRELQTLKVADAAPVPPAVGASPEAATQARTNPMVTWGKSNLPKGTAFTRYAITLLRAKGDSYRALEIAKQWRDSTPEVEIAIKAAVAAGNTTDSTWAAPLAVARPMSDEFVELLYPMTILGKLTGVSNVPFNVSLPRQTAGTVSGWVGEDNPKPVSRLSFETITLARNKIATIVVLSEELVQDSSPSAEALVRNDMLKSVAAYSDSQFIDPTVTASGAVRPASITNGLTTHNMTGTTVAAVLTDMATLMSGYINANVPFENATWIMHPRTALYLSMLLSPLGTQQFPNISVAGGTFMGFRVITSSSVPIDTGADSYIILIDPSSVMLADGGINVDVSREASLQMDSAPTDSAQSVISLWQNNLVGLRCERRISYRRRREAAVQVLSAVSY